MRVLFREYNRHVCVETDNVMAVHFVPLRESETMSITDKMLVPSALYLEDKSGREYYVVFHGTKTADHYVKKLYKDGMLDLTSAKKNTFCLPTEDNAEDINNIIVKRVKSLRKGY